MAIYQVINLQAGEFSTATLEEAAEIASLDPHEIEWATEEHGVSETAIHQITKLPEPSDEDGVSALDQLDGDASDAGDADSITPLPVFVFITQEEFEAHLAQHPANVIRLKWDEPIMRDAVEADRERVTGKLRGDAGEGEEPAEPSGVFHLTRESIALLREMACGRGPMRSDAYHLSLGGQITSARAYWNVNSTHGSALTQRSICMPPPAWRM
jgi:hypothetical protein